VRRRGALSRAGMAIVIAAVAATDAGASPAQDLDRARFSFREHDYDSAMKLATYLLYPDEKLAAPADLVEAHVILGASNFETGHRIEAKNEFEKALQIQPDKMLTDKLFSEGAIRVFDETKADIEARAERDAQLRKLADERERIRKYRESLVFVEKRSFVINFAPFGAGQFQNKQPGRGILFAAGQGLTGGISVGVFLYLAGKYGLVAKVPFADVARVRELQQLEIGTGVAFFAVYAWGVVDALLNYKPTVQIEGDSLPPSLRDLPQDRTSKPPAKKSSALDRLHIHPLIAPDAAGIALTWEND
jgi:TM2 domain-containing membrane protein YozV